MKFRRCWCDCLVAVGLVFAVAAGCTATDAPSEPPVAAFVNADCAPWDGAAFTISVPIDTGRLITVSIYQAPDLPHRASFSFPDDSGRVGQASYRPETGPDEPLMGTVSVFRVQRGTPIEGEFDLRSVSGFRYRAPFLATWAEVQAYCG